MRTCWLLLALALALAAAAAAAPAQDAGSFEKGVAGVRQEVQRERWKDARRELDLLLERHAGTDHALARRDELIALFQDIAFRLAYPKPDPAGLVDGELVSWNPRTKKLHVRYDPDHLRDFTRQGAGEAVASPELAELLRQAGGDHLTHRARFTGPVLVELTGASYPASGRGGAITVCQDEKSGYEVVFGTPQVSLGGSVIAWFPARIYRLEAREREELDYREMSPGRGGKPFKLTVKVGKTSIRGAYDGRSVLVAHKPADCWGQVGFDPGVGWKQFQIQGTTDGSWIAALVAKKDAELRRRFEAEWDADAELPDWLRDG